MIISLLVELLKAVVVFIVGYIWSSRDTFKIRIKAIFKRKKDIRVSLSYLYSIKIEDKYLLIQGNRISQYQPVGGVYKYYDSFLGIKQKLDVKDEKKANFHEDNDLRVIVKGKNLFSLIKWFESGENRETSFFREFYEELISSNILMPNDMANVKFEFLRREKTELKYSEHFQKDELLIYDIIDVHLTKEMENKILSYAEKSDEIKLVDSNEIKRECLDREGLSTKIGEHAKLIL